MIRLTFIALLPLLLLFSACTTVTPPVPMATLGGPETVSKGEGELTLAGGGGFVNMENRDPDDGAGFGGRFVYGLDEDLDFGADVLWVDRGDFNAYFGAKLFGRTMLSDNVRLEAGLGMVDDSDLDALGGDIGLTFGSTQDETINFYGSPRYAFSIGYDDGELFSGSVSDPANTPDAPNTHTVLLSLGAQLELHPRYQLLLEAGHGYIIASSGDFDAVPLYYFAVATRIDLFGSKE